MVPMVFFALTILSLTGIARGVEGLLEEEARVPASEKGELADHRDDGSLDENDFLFIERKFDRGS